MSENSLMGPLKGRNGKLIIYPNYVEIDRGRSMSAIITGMHGNKRIYYKDVGSVDYKKSGLAVGYIQFSPLGSMDSSGIMKTIKNENAITFASKPKLWEEAYHLILQQVEKCKNISTEKTEISDNLSNIEKAYELYSKGIISESEFEEIKKKNLYSPAPILTDVKICPSCTTKVSLDANFCPKCRTQL